MPSPAPYRLTLAPGDYSRVCKQTGSGIESESFNAAYGSGNKVLICKVLPQPLKPAS